MSEDITVKQISPRDAYNAVDDELFDRIANDRCTRENIAGSYNNGKIYLGAYTGGELAGFLTFSPESSLVVTIHCNFIKKHRRLAHKSCQKILSAFLSRFPDVLKYKAIIPVIYPDVIGFAKKFGFEEEGTDRQSFLKNGSVVDRKYLGVLKSDLERFLK